MQGLGMNLLFNGIEPSVNTYLRFVPILGGGGVYRIEKCWKSSFGFKFVFRT